MTKSEFMKWCKELAVSDPNVFIPHLLPIQWQINDKRTPFEVETEAFWKVMKDSPFIKEPEYYKLPSDQPVQQVPDILCKIGPYTFTTREVK
jgi:hypothetical protein